MEKLILDLEHCYGIKELKAELDFSETQAYAIYAPNGVMKSSLAQTFQDAADNVDSVDRIFTERNTSRKITNEAANEIEGERILVVRPYDEEFGPTEKTSTLLVDAKLRKEFEELHVAINKAKATLTEALRKQSGSKAHFEYEIASAFTNDDDFDTAVRRIQSELDLQKDAPYESVNYDVIFNDKVSKALETESVRNAVEDYIRRYNELLTNSTFFKKGTFDYYNAAQIAKSLADNGFFDAQHTVQLKASGENLEINTQNELEKVIADEKEAILKDPTLQTKFDNVAKQLQRNADLRAFCRYLQDNEPLLSRMTNLAKFREDVLKSYLKVHHGIYLELMDKYDAAAKRKAAIVKEAKKQETQWEEVISIFNERFFVPFKLETKNRIEVMLGSEKIVELSFTYTDNDESKTVEKPQLLQVLSTGERKSLYVLNVIFEIERRKKDGVETLVVVDDIADSFDYQNKYAIIQYLSDISEAGLFKLIMMTHNFDFFRTVEGRFVKYANCLMASKDQNGISLSKATGIRNIFAKDWKINFFEDPRKKVASIAFLRNLLEMTTGVDGSDYQILTAMLHWKANTEDITVEQLDNIFNSMCGTTKSSADPSARVHALISVEADKCEIEGPNLPLESKIVLAIATRLAADRFMISKIHDETFVAGIKRNQTQALIREFKERFETDTETLKILDRVALMTPENIHLNSFMYEPIVDMGGDQLQKLYAAVKTLAE